MIIKKLFRESGRYFFAEFQMLLLRLGLSVFVFIFK